VDGVLDLMQKMHQRQYSSRPDRLFTQAGRPGGLPY
jgi:hypothetical protein